MCYCSTTNARYQKATEDQALSGSKPLAVCHYSNTCIKKKFLLDILYDPKIGTLICSPYPTWQLSKSWQSLDGVFPKNKGKAKSHFSCKMQWVPVTNRFLELINSWWHSQHKTSLLIIMTEFKIVLDFRTKKNNRVMIQITLPVIIISLQIIIVTRSAPTPRTQ